MLKLQLLRIERLILESWGLKVFRIIILSIFKVISIHDNTLNEEWFLHVSSLFSFKHKKYVSSQIAILLII